MQLTPDYLSITSARLDTRARFMRNVVNQQPFTHYPRLLEMLQEVEQTFTEINAVQGERWVGWDTAASYAQDEGKCRGWWGARRDGTAIHSFICIHFTN